MIYTVCIEEKVVQNFEIEAKSEADALAKAEAGYRQGKYVLEPGELQEMSVKVLE